ncbi:carbohydrate kinase family protein [Patescibacteria group bacterium]|nr:MAG: carbohydrate kinase family protein [Patescibacteria group bacterium]
MYNLITIGDAVIDTHVFIDDATVQCDVNHENCQLCLDYASKVPITGSFQSLGGNAANVAVGATKLGLKCAAITSLGTDANGKLILEELKKNNVDTSLTSQDPRTLTRYSIILNFKGERTILSYHQKRKYDWPRTVPPVDWIYYTSLSEGFENLQEKLLAFLDKHGTARLAFNPGSFQIKNALPKVREMLKRTDVLIVNLEEAEKISDLTLAKAKSVAGLIRKLLNDGAKEVVITDAANGAWAGNVDEVWRLESFPVKVVAKTGAGDAFSAGYLSARFYGHEIPLALSWGIANSCGVISEVGSLKGILDKNGIKKMLAKFSTIKPSTVIARSEATKQSLA